MSLGRVYRAYSMSASDNPNRVTYKTDVVITVTLVLFDMADIWKALRLLLSVGARIEKSLGSPLALPSIQRNSEDQAVLTGYTHLPKAKAEDALHSIYLWLEHPEKYE